MELFKLSFTVNGKKYELNIKPNRTLAQVLREDLGLYGTKIGCEEGECGACTVIIDGKSVTSCLMLAVQANGREIMTIEGLQNDDGTLHPIQEAFAKSGAVQCGYCMPGMILSTKALLDKHPSPNEEQIREGLTGNLCRCTGYQKIFEAVNTAAETLAVGGNTE